MQPSLVAAEAGARFVLACEHASAAVPPELGDLGLRPADLATHIASDIGAADLTRALAARLGAPAVLAPVSRLVVDCNRHPDAPDAIVTRSDGIDVPGNRALDSEARQARVTAYHAPYHAMVAACLRQHPEAMLVSIHSFTPELAGVPRSFDVGVLFDLYAGYARRWIEAIATHGLDVRANEPYSGLDGLIYSARRHGLEHGRVYLEVEVKDALLRDEESIARIAEALANGLRSLWEE